MPSGRKRKPLEPEEPIFFLDRNLGRYDVPEAIRDRGFSVLSMADVYLEGKDQRVTDPDWIIRANLEGWIVLTKDYAIIRDHVDVLSKTTLRVFALNNANLTGAQMVDRILRNLNRIIRLANKPGPYVYAIGSRGLELRWKPQTRYG